MASYEHVSPPLFLPLISKPYKDPTLTEEACRPILATTLADFRTNHPEPRKGHEDWLRGDFAQKVNSRPGNWVYLRAHASPLGDPNLNMDLSERRRQQVAAIIRSVAPNVRRCDGVARGEEINGVVVSQNDNSSSLRSVELMVYPPEIPMPAPQIQLKTPHMVYRETVLIRESTDGPIDVSGGKAGQAADIGVNLITAPIQLNDHLARHPYDTGDYWFGAVTASRTADVDSSFLLSSVNIEKVVKKYPDEHPLLGGLTIHRTDFTRRYTFIYGPGRWGQKVAVYRRETYIGETGKTTTSLGIPFFVDQPPSYVDP